MNKGLFLAILAMDAYNREPTEGIEVGASGQIGNATVIDRLTLGIDQNIFAAWQAQGFHAEAYAVNGEIVISFRGNDRARNPRICTSTV